MKGNMPSYIQNMKVYVHGILCTQYEGLHGILYTEYEGLHGISYTEYEG